MVIGRMHNQNRGKAKLFFKVINSTAHELKDLNSPEGNNKEWPGQGAKCSRSRSMVWLGWYEANFGVISGRQTFGVNKVVLIIREMDMFGQLTADLCNGVFLISMVPANFQSLKHNDYN